MRKTTKPSQAQNIRNYFIKNPGKTVSEVAKAMGVKYQIAYMTRRDMIKRAEKLAAQGRNPLTGKIRMQAAEPLKEPQPWKTVHVSISDTPLPVTMEEPKADPVNHPAHYKYGGIETIDFIEAKDLNYRLGNVVKYISRAGKKDSDPVQDLEKAAWYLKREIDARKGA